MFLPVVGEFIAHGRHGKRALFHGHGAEIRRDLVIVLGNDVLAVIDRILGRVGVLPRILHGKRSGAPHFLPLREPFGGEIVVDVLLPVICEGGGESRERELSFRHFQRAVLGRDLVFARHVVAVFIENGKRYGAVGAFAHIHRRRKFRLDAVPFGEPVTPERQLLGGVRLAVVLHRLGRRLYGERPRDLFHVPVVGRENVG